MAMEPSNMNHWKTAISLIYLISACNSYTVCEYNGCYSSIAARTSAGDNPGIEGMPGWA